jgi:hypothetical protein
MLSLPGDVTDLKEMPGSFSCQFAPARVPVPRKSQPLQHGDHVVTGVDLPPPEAHPSGGWKCMVVVVPALTQGQDTHHEVVSALVPAVVGV